MACCQLLRPMGHGSTVSWMRRFLREMSGCQRVGMHMPAGDLMLKITWNRNPGALNALLCCQKVDVGGELIALWMHIS